MPIPGGVTVTVSGPKIGAKGSKGELTLTLPSALTAEVKDGAVALRRQGDEKFLRSLHGTYRSLLANMLFGVNKGYSKALEIQGVGYRAQLQGRKLVLNLGYSHPIEYLPPDGITLGVSDNTAIQVSGSDKQLVGQVSARIKAFAPAEPYKGKGVRFKGEYVRRKAGKTVA